MATALITGANRGLGFEFTRQYLAAAWHVIAACRKPDDAGALRALQASHSRLQIVAIDVARQDSIERAAADLGAQPVDVLINNAGLFGPSESRNNDWRQSFGHIDRDVWLDLLNVNTIAPVKMAEAFITNIAAGEQKKIVTLSSGYGSIADTGPGGLYAYRTSKAAVNMAMATLAKDLSSQGIVVALLCPGWCRTDMGGPRAPNDPAESVARMRGLIDELELTDSGAFIHHSGRRLPW